MSILKDVKWDCSLNCYNIESESYIEFEQKFKGISNDIFSLLESELLDKELHSKFNKAQCNNVDLESLIDQNRQYKLDIDLKYEELSKKQKNYETYQKDRKILSQEIKETYEAFLKAKKYYKKFLRIYYTIEKTTDSKQIILLQFFTQSKRDLDNYSIRLSRDIQSFKYELIDMKPNLKNYKELQKYVQETNDLPGTLCQIRQAFLKLKHNK